MLPPLTSEELTAIDLPKWPAMVVVGDDVTLAQAAEIIVRTNCWWATCNDRRWLSTVWGILGVEVEDPSNPHSYKYDSLKWATASLDPVPLEYLNNSRIMSSWIGGAHGWCDWKGRIYSVNYNIGKWPSAKGVLEEWQAIAKAFPFLNLRCQLWSKETSEEGSVPLVEYAVNDGMATAWKPSTLGVVPSFDVGEAVLGLGFLARERGCDEETLRSAIIGVRTARVKVQYDETVDRMAADLQADIDAEIVAELLKHPRKATKKGKK